jgi:hypothetical protein
MSVIRYLMLLLLYIPAFSKQADIGDRKNRASFRAGYLVGYLASDDFPLALNYERFITNNFTIGGSIGHIAIPKYEGEKYYLGEITGRKYFFGDYQRMVVSISAFSKYHNIWANELTTALVGKLGYLWQWKYVYTSLEGGLGPGFYKNVNMEMYKVDFKVVDAYLNVGFIF